MRDGVVLPSVLLCECSLSPLLWGHTPGPGAWGSEQQLALWKIQKSLVWGFCLKCSIHNSNNKRKKSLTCKWLCLAEPSNQIQWLFFYAHPEFLWGFVSKLVGAALGPGQRGLRGAWFLGVGAGHGGDGGCCFFLPGCWCLRGSPQEPCSSLERGPCVRVCTKGWVSRRTWALVTFSKSLDLFWVSTVPGVGAVSGPGSAAGATRDQATEPSGL